MSGRGGDDGKPVPASTGEQPDALELLRVARETLLEQVLPALEGDHRYHALMIGNAMAIALRELAPGHADLEAELAALRGLYEQPDPARSPRHGERSGDALERLEARLARDLRDGVLDGGPQYAVRRWLRARLEARLAVSNPRALARRGAATGDDRS